MDEFEDELFNEDKLNKVVLEYSREAEEEEEREEESDSEEEQEENENRHRSVVMSFTLPPS